jgi:hypothetical protein
MKRAVVITPSSGYMLPYESACKLLELLADAMPLDSSYDTACGFERAKSDRYSRLHLQPLSVAECAEIELAKETED